MADIIDVAKYILDSHKSTTGIKLHKILYYCQIWHFIDHKSNLFEADFSFKENGVICDTLYYKMHLLVSGNQNRLSDLEIASINKTLSRYIKLTIHDLVNLNKKEIPEGTKKIIFPDIIQIYSSPSPIDNPSY